MKEHTVKLSGHAKDRFLERFFAEEAGLDPEARDRLVRRSKSVMTSLRVRKAVLSGLRRVASTARPVSPQEASAPQAEVVSAPVDLPSPVAPEPNSSPVVREPSPAEIPQPAAAPAPKPFDAYAVKLVPVFQREGREGLLDKLATVSEVDQLRQIAKAQQIVLPQPLRSGDTDAEIVRRAIVDAVEKRIADRRAAAG